MMHNFNKFIVKVLEFEGGYSNHPNDSGGETMMGVCRKYHPELRIWKSLDKHKTIASKKRYKPSESELNEIYAIYRKNYYDPCKCDRIEDVCLAYQVFDMAVNAGVKRAIKLLQGCLNVKDDGIIGAITLSAANTYGDKINDKYKEARDNYYTYIGTGKNAVFLKGWLRRSKEALEYGKTL